MSELLLCLFNTVKKSKIAADRSSKECPELKFSGNNKTSSINIFDA